MWPFERKDAGLPELHAELLVLCEAWFERQIGDVPKDELPPRDEIEDDIVRMRDGVFGRVIGAVPSDAFLDETGRPDDARNRARLEALADAYRGHEATTPILVGIALAKANEPGYGAGWPLAAVRLVAKAWLEQSTT